MDVFVVVRRKKLTLYLQSTDISTVFEIKKKLSAILKRKVEDMKLYRREKELEDSDTMLKVGITFNTAKCFDPARIDMSFKQDDASFEPLDIEEYTRPPPETSYTFEGPPLETSYTFECCRA